jgi:hypothetical protein
MYAAVAMICAAYPSSFREVVAGQGASAWENHFLDRFSRALLHGSGSREMFREGLLVTEQRMVKNVKKAGRPEAPRSVQFRHGRTFSPSDFVCSITYDAATLGTTAGVEKTRDEAKTKT